MLLRGVEGRLLSKVAGYLLNGVSLYYAPLMFVLHNCNYLLHTEALNSDQARSSMCELFIGFLLDC